MLGDIGLGELLVLFLVGLFLVGPDRLPGFAADAARVLRNLRRMAAAARTELTEELGPELGEITTLGPRRVLAKHLFAEDDAVAVPSVPSAAADGEAARSGR